MATNRPTYAPKGAQTAQKAPVSRAAPVAAPTPALRPANAVALPDDLMAELGAAAKDAAAKERPAVGRISLKSGQMSYGGQPVPGNAMDVLIVGSGHRNVFYAGAYNPDNIVNPNCFAMGGDDEGMAAHENVPDSEVPPASDDVAGKARETPRSCVGCSKNAWGSAIRNGLPSKGKACKETRRLVLMPTDVLEGETIEEVVNNIKGAELAILDLPVTSVGNYANLVSTLAATMNLPVWAVVTNVHVVPDPRNQFSVRFTAIEPAGSEAVIRALMTRREEAMRIATQPYDGVGGETDPDAGKAAPAAPMKTSKFTAKPRK